MKARHLALPHLRWPLVLLAACLGLSGCTALGKVGQVLWDSSIPVGAPGDQLSQFSLSLDASPSLNLNAHSLLADALPPSDAQGAPLAVTVEAGNPVELADKLQNLLDGLRQEHPALSRAEYALTPAPAMSPVVDVGSYQDASVHLTSLPTTLVAPQATTPIAFQVLQLKDDSMLLNASYEALADDLKKALGSTLLAVDDYRLMPGQFKFVGFEEIHPATRYLAVIAHYHERDGSDWKRVLPLAPRGHRHPLLVRFENNGVVLKGQG
jgi:type VI secretion system VasD/TssJ family lipoprotein